jgi:hypothetical protein
MKKNLYYSFNLRLPAVVLFAVFIIWNSSTYCQSSASTEIFPNNTLLRRITVKTALNPPEGFKLKVLPRFYGTPDARLEQGTIFNYIDGAGENYIKHGFHFVGNILLENSAGDRITIDIYDLSSIQNAQDAFEDTHICAPSTSLLDLGIRLRAKVYSYPPDYMLYFVEDRFLVQINMNNDAFKDIAEVLSVQIIKLINER